MAGGARLAVSAITLVNTTGRIEIRGCRARRVADLLMRGGRRTRCSQGKTLAGLYDTLEEKLTTLPVAPAEAI